MPDPQQLTHILKTLGRIADVAEKVAEQQLARKELPPLRSSMPRKLSSAMLIDAVPGFAAQFKRVPDEFVDGDRVACPCGETVMLEPLEFADCPTCERVYVGRAGAGAWVTYQESRGGQLPPR